jgi:hypothetical protein
MRRLVAVAPVLLGCAPGPSHEGGRVDSSRASRELLIRAIERRWAPPTGEQLERVEVTPVTGEPGLHVALFDSASRWLGDFACFSFRAGRIDWVASMNEEEAPDAPAMESVRGLRLMGFEHPIVEVFSRTHMGNGALYLFELRERRLRRIFETRAVDFHWGDGGVIRNGVLQPDYSDLNSDGIADITLTGTVDEVEDSGRRVVSSGQIRETFLWSTRQRAFAPRAD